MNLRHAFCVLEERENFSQMPSIFKQWKKDQNGSTAVEFALIGIPFIFMVVGIIEMALMFTAQSLLEASTAEASRQIRIGAVQQGGGVDAFEDALCDFAKIIMNCDDLQYQVESVESFQEAEDLPDASFDDEGNLENQGFDPGGVSDVVLIRIAYKYAVNTPMMKYILSNQGNSSRLLLSTVVLQTEPYEFEDD